MCTSRPPSGPRLGRRIAAKLTVPSTILRETDSAVKDVFPSREIIPVIATFAPGAPAVKAHLAASIGGGDTGGRPKNVSCSIVRRDGEGVVWHGVIVRSLRTSTPPNQQRTENIGIAANAVVAPRTDVRSNEALARGDAS